ncbi:MAG TPA: hypothetical protein DIU35_13155, partial [Candidatus Latescibacteria bacterium]|nr:hypothetical protein [Candidatus Latescibacterota bacterium]
KKPFFLFGKIETRISWMRRIDTDLAPFFLNTISWRYKSTPPEQLFKTNSPLDTVQNTIQGEIEFAQSFSDNLYDQYLLLTLNNLSRHSMYIEGSLLRPYLEDRTPGLDNDLFDFGIRIPYHYKADYRLYKEAIRLIDPRYLEATNANTNYRTRYGQLRTSALLLNNILKERLGLDHVLPPKANERSWGDEQFIFKNNPGLRKVIAGYKSFSMWDILPEIDKDTVFAEIQGHLSGISLNKTLMHHLLCIETMLQEKA